jgi:hypothetical protein
MLQIKYLFETSHKSFVDLKIISAGNNHVALAKHPAIKLPKLVLLMRLLAKVSNSGKTEALQPQHIWT